MFITATGKPGAEYHKQLLVPFGEYLPFEGAVPGFRRFFPHVRYYVPGKEPVVFDIGQGKHVIPVICFEMLFSEHLLEFARKGGNIILNMNDEAYFGRTEAPKLLLAMGKFRAVEYRMPVVRVTNSGTGGFVEATGEIALGYLTPSFRQDVVVMTLFAPSERSFFLRGGYLFKWILFAAFLFYLGRTATIRRRRYNSRKS